ncbi:malto-oligosyltrehalose trehalohydrolase [Pseudactinotalea sp. Z1739]|uniref:malto-oligosyltrehalose trehalohydrolase n=1 Tax=Pseudactinotalea sp. Z1739 TaxID=3413028 RepID=UPI003C7D2412
MSVPARVWAPNAEQVEIDLPGTGARAPMRPGGEGWWASEPVLEAGTDYAFSLDGGPLRPDPRSPWQPQGVHAPSRWYDPADFDWTDREWAGKGVHGAVIYELHIGTFTPDGTLDAAIERLDHLVALGVDIVELMPVAAFPGERGWGYDGVGLYAVQHPYGGPAALARFVDAAHNAGLGVALDVVFNHLGPSGNYLGEFGPYFTDRHHTPWGAAVNLDGPDSAPVRAFIIECALRWLDDFHIDALRLDAVHELKDDSGEHLLAELSRAVADLSSRVGRPLGLIAESDLNDAAMVAPVTAGGRGMDAQWADDVHHAIHAYLTGERHGYYADFGDAATLAKALTRVFVHDGTYSSFRGRHWGAPVPPEVSGHAFVASLNTHDQVGNRGLGDRPSATLSPGRLAIGAALLLAGPYTPMLFMGEEWGATTPWLFFTDHAEEELAEAIRAGRQAEFGDHGWAQLYGRADLTVPDPQDRRTFTASVLDWSEPAGTDHARLLAFYTDLVALRRDHPDLAGGDRTVTTVDFDDDAGWLTMRRGSSVVALNTGTAQQVPLPAGTGRGVLAAWDPDGTFLTDDGARVHLGADCVVVLG